MQHQPNSKPARTTRDWVGLVLFIIIVIFAFIPAIAVACSIAVLSWVFEEEIVRSKEKDKFNS